MVDLCHSSPCLNNGKCVVNISQNDTCQCNQCYSGTFCEHYIKEQQMPNNQYVLSIIFLFGLGLSLLNNGLTFELCICSKRIRRGNCGIYLIIYSIIAIVSNVLIAVQSVVRYYPNQLHKNEQAFDTFLCVFYRIGYKMFSYLCVLFSTAIAFERGLIIWRDEKTNGSRWRSFIITIIMFVIAGSSAAPFIVHKCKWFKMKSLGILNEVFLWFYMVAGIGVYLVVTLFVLISFTRRIHRYGTENGSFIKTFLNLLRTHLFIFIPPIVTVVSSIPYPIAKALITHGHSYFECGISTGEYIVRVAIYALQGVPTIITWLLFVYPSRIYMNEFYLNTWSGRRVANIYLMFFKQYDDRRKGFSVSNTTGDQENHRACPLGYDCQPGTRTNHNFYTCDQGGNSKTSDFKTSKDFQDFTRLHQTPRGVRV